MILILEFGSAPLKACESVHCPASDPLAQAISPV